MVIMESGVEVEKMSKKIFKRIVVETGYTGMKTYYSIEYIEHGKLCQGYTSDSLEKVIACKKQYFDYVPGPGDEVEVGVSSVKAIVTLVHEGTVYIMYRDGSTAAKSLNDIWATGKHYKRFDKLMKDFRRH